MPIITLACTACVGKDSRIAALEYEVDMWRKHVVELEATIRRVIPGTPATESDWVKLVGEKEALEARIKVLEALTGAAK